MDDNLLQDIEWKVWLGEDGQKLAKPICHKNAEHSVTVVRDIEGKAIVSCYDCGKILSMASGDEFDKEETKAKLQFENRTS